MTVRYHRTLKGELVVVGPPSEVKLGLVYVSSGVAGAPSKVLVVRLGKTFIKNFEKVRYGYLGSKK